jgi:hypothetical protein
VVETDPFCEADTLAERLGQALVDRVNATVRVELADADVLLDKVIDCDTVSVGVPVDDEHAEAERELVTDAVIVFEGVVSPLVVVATESDAVGQSVVEVDRDCVGETVTVLCGLLLADDEMVVKDGVPEAEVEELTDALRPAEGLVDTLPVADVDVHSLPEELMEEELDGVRLDVADVFGVALEVTDQDLVVVSVPQTLLVFDAPADLEMDEHPVAVLLARPLEEAVGDADADLLCKLERDMREDADDDLLGFAL